MWGDVYLLIAISLSFAIIVIKYPNSVKDIKITSCTAIVIYLIGEFSLLFESHYSQIVKTLSLIKSLSLIFVILLMLIRRLKPVVFQYPYPIVFLPLLLPVSYSFVMDILIVEQIILASIQSVIIVVIFLLSAGYFGFFRGKTAVVIGVTALISSFILYWMLMELLLIDEWTWKLAASVGMVLIIYAISDLLINKFSFTGSQEK